VSVLALVEELNPDHESIALAEAAPMAMQLLLDLEAGGLLTPRALHLPDGIEYTRSESLGVFLGELKSRGNFYLGDWLIDTEQRFPEQFSQAADSTGLAEQTNLRVMAVCRNVPESRRNACSWSVHAAVSGLPAREQKAWLARALKSGWGYSELRKHMQAARHEERPQLPGIEAGEPDAALLIDAVRSLLANAEDAGENVICRREDIARVRAAVGMEEA
jgi:hypothetical protein